VRRPIALLPALPALLLAACSDGAGAGDRTAAGADLSGLEVRRVEVGAAAVVAWIADDPAEREQGLMFATDAQLAPLPDGTPRGMLFQFAGEVFASFWMRNTLVALDLAYATADGTIVEIFPLEPLDETLVPSSQPVQFALEVPRGTLAAFGVAVGDRIVIP